MISSSPSEFRWVDEVNLSLPGIRSGEDKHCWIGGWCPWLFMLKEAEHEELFDPLGDPDVGKGTCVHQADSMLTHKALQ
jgi:hypothetical protein